jgi:uncharacterized protein (UPF0335 family)
MTNLGNNSTPQLKAFVERIERLEGEKKELSDDIRDVYGEAKSGGFDVKALRAIVKMRREDAEKRREHEAIVETYAPCARNVVGHPAREGGNREGGAGMSTLGEELPKEMARVRDILIPQYQSIGPAGNFAIAFMRSDLDAAAKAMAEGDLPEMIRVYQRLKDYKS